MGKKKKPQEQKQHKYTASHIMLSIILLVYFLVAMLGIIFVIICICNGIYENGVQLMIALFSYAAICGSSTIIVYSNKATKENELKISNDKYRIRLELAKEIYKEIADNSLDDKSLLLLKILTADESGASQTTANADTTTIQQNNFNSEGLG